jgi:hypothetical protein
MKPESDGSPLHMPLSSSGLSDALIREAILHGFNTPADFLELPLTKLAKLDWLKADMLEELMNYLRNTGVYHLKENQSKKKQ